MEENTKILLFEISFGVRIFGPELLERTHLLTRY